MHSSRMRTARNSSRPGGLHQTPPPGPGNPPRARHPPPEPGTPPPPEQAPPAVNRMTNRCKNITLPQTSFAGGKNYHVEVRRGTVG